MNTAPPLSHSLRVEHARTPTSGRHGLRRRLAAAFAAKLSWVALQFIQQFVLVPVFLHYWGPQAYGDWVALFSVASVLTLFDFGLSQYYANGFLIAWAKRDVASFDRLLRVGLGAVGACALVGMLLALPVAGLSPWVQMLNLETVAGSETAKVLLALGACFAARLPLGLALAIYRARGDQATGIFAETLASLAQFVAVLAALHLGGGLSEVGFAHAAAAGVSWVAAAAHLRWRYPDLRLRTAAPSRGEIRSALRVCPYFAALPAALAVQIYGVVLVTSAFAAPAVAIVYTTHRTLTGAARMLVSHLGQAVATELARQHTQGDVAAFARLYAFLGRLVGGISGGIAGLIAVLGPPVMSLWTFDHVPVDATVFWALLAAGLVTVPAEAAEKLLSALNHPRTIAIGFGARALLAIAGSLALVPALGAAGAALSILGAEALTVAWMLPCDAARHTRALVVRQFVLGWGVAAVSFGLSAAIAFASTSVLGTASIAELVASAALWTAVAPAAAMFILFDRSQRRVLMLRATAALRQAEG